VYLSRSRAPESLVLGCGEIDSAVCVYCCPSETSVLNSSFTRRRTARRAGCIEGLTFFGEIN
jgi:hypothetical protein